MFHSRAISRPPMSRLAAALLATTFLAACGDKADVPATSVDAPVPVADVPVTEQTQAVGAVPAGNELNEDLILENVSVTLTQEGQPTYIASEDVLLFNIKVANNGQTDLVGAGTKPVNLGALLLGPEGPDKAPGIREFVRVPLPHITKGSQATLQAKLPADALKGQKIQFQLVQEGVAWFESFGQAPLDLGGYSRCANEAKDLCDDAGTPVTRQ